MGFYYKFFEGANWFVLALPFLIALPMFSLSYRFVYMSHTARLRTRTIVKKLSQWLRICAIALCLLSLVPVIVFGSFSNEFVRIAILATTFGYTYWAHLHWIVRILVSSQSMPYQTTGYNNAHIRCSSHGDLLLKRVPDLACMLSNR